MPVIVFPDDVDSQKEFYYSNEYLKLLVGRNIVDKRNNKRVTYKVLELLAIGTKQRNQSHPSLIKYQTDHGEVMFHWPVVIMLIEGIYAKDRDGFEYEVIT